MFILQTLILLVTVLTSLNISYALDLSIEKSISENTFILVPINQYASVISKEKAEEFVNKNCSLSHLPPSEILNCKSLKQCKEGNCIREFESHGTAFLLNEGRVLYTAWHVVFPSHAAALYFAKNYVLTLPETEQNIFFNKLEPSFVLLDHNQNLVYDSRKEPSTIYVNAGHVLSTVFNQEGWIKDRPYGYYENIPEDHVEIQLSKSLGSGLTKSETPITLDQTFSTSGFSYDGYSFKFSINYGKQEKLYSLKSNSGVMQFLLEPMKMDRNDFLNHSLIEQLIMMGYSGESASEQISTYGEPLIEQSIRTVLKAHDRHDKDFLVEQYKNVLFTNNKVLPGQSGGPVLNEKGEVVGLITNGIFDYNSTNKTYKSYGAGIHLFN